MKFIDRLRNKEYKTSYSQCGEDLIASFVLNDCLKIENPSYLDIGSHHPTFLSNTYLFYKNGCSGVCVEPDPVLHAEIKRRRNRDVCLNLGIGIDSEKMADFYVMNARTLNTFSRDTAEAYAQIGHYRIEQEIKVSLLPVNEIVQRYFNKYPNFISLDTEGMDLAILKSFDFLSYRPEVFCVETMTYSEDRTGVKVTEILSFMAEKEYFVYADTYINTLFVDKKAWSRK